MMDYERCIGCRYCQLACPYGARSFNWETYTGENTAVPEWGEPEIERRPRGVVEKCSFCFHRIDRGLAEGLTPGVDRQATPACVAVCPVGARIFGDLNDPDSPVSQALAKYPAVQAAPGFRHRTACLLPASATRRRVGGGLMNQKIKLHRAAFPLWVALLTLLMLAGLAAAIMVLVQGLVLTNLTDLVPWGLWIGIDLSAIALSAGAFSLSAAVYLLGWKQLASLARTAVFIGLLGYSMAMMTLLMDIGRPDRFWHAIVFWNIHSPLWEVTMCVVLYFSVLLLEVAPIFGGASWFKQRWPRLAGKLQHIHKFAPVLAIAGLFFSLLHQSSLGATYGVLKARPIWYKPSLAVLFIVSAVIGDWP